MTGVTMAAMLEQETHILIACDRPTCDRHRRLTPTEAVAAFGSLATFADLRPRMRCKVCGWLGADVRPDWSDVDARGALDVALKDTGRINGVSLPTALKEWDARRPKDAPSPIAEQARALLAMAPQASAAPERSPACPAAGAANEPPLPRAHR